ncbi:hypothetical protein FD754_019350 [Muntiacus muntjak]|uniref:Uncharacterized protein n=1 Tax=Muntiacus muntjak TaxID=9888 RepID=A0A5N3UZY7_MUNMU|nr:hypothetical protein FD754_019350 [Muntiacus muntjak]
MTKATRKPQQSRRVAMRFASRKNGKKKTLCQRRCRGSSKKVKKTREPICLFSPSAHKKWIQSWKRYQNMRQSQRRRHNPKRK